MQTGYIGLLELQNYELGEFDYKEMQAKKLKNHCENTSVEKHIAYNGKMEIDHLIDRLTNGDTLVICSLKFLAHNRDILYDRIKAIEDNSITLKVLDMEESTFSSHIKAFMAFNTYISGMRVKKGAHKARFYKAYKAGRKIAVSEQDRQEVIRKRTIKISGVKQPTVTELAEYYKCSRQTIYNILKGN
ncbi:recombinase family protein [Candidatus Colwellia aromaticivorans]|uniref:recombinase family protein n=1 Tax=Candidatus Colwellia aromaticivorans TaxID=2267621 RepID=UPI000DF1987A|nr:recombinase family protein [Candidatus Colwellia aromaticivorans]